VPSRAAIKAVADALSDPQNELLTAEEVAERAISAYEEAQAKTHNLVVLGHFRLEDDTSYVAAVGPLSTRAVASARGVGEHFAWDYKTRRGTGKFVLVPLIRDPNRAWDEARNEGLEEFDKHLNSIVPGGDEPTYEAMRFEIPPGRRAEIVAEWQKDPEILSRKYAPGCVCGLSERYIKGNRGYSKYGVPTMDCPRHPEGRNDGSA